MKTAMATISDITSTPLSGLNHIDALLDSGPDWNYLTPSGNILRYTFSLASGTEENTTGQEAFTFSQQEATRGALAYIAQLTGIQFIETNVGTDAQIHLSNMNLSPGNVTGLCSWHSSYGYLGNQLSSYDADAYVYLDNTEWRSANFNLVPGTQGYETLLHELGHALGLKHPFDVSSDNTARLPAAQDNTANTLLSYTDGAAGSYATFQQYDIAALNWLYGGDGLRGSLGINATEGRYITGTKGADTLSGTAANDKLEGDGGNDMIDGGAGTDTAVFNMDRSNYSFSALANGDLQVSGSDGTDILRSIELLQFSGNNVVHADVLLADTVAPAAPLMTVTKNGNGYASGANPGVTGSGEAGATIKIYTSNNVQVGSATVDANGLWTAKLGAFKDGLNYQVYAVAVDAAGNASTHSATAVFNVDATAPVYPTAKLAYTAGANQATVSGTGEAGTELSLYTIGVKADFSDTVEIARTTVGNDGKWTIATSPLPNGNYIVRSVSTDKAGNASSSDTTLSFNVNSALNLAGTANHDKLVAPVAGNNAIDGQDGIDTVLYGGTRASYTVSKEVWGFGVTDNSGAGGHDAVINVERLQFSDDYLALDIDGTAGQVFRLYQAVFGRPAEEGGQGFWMWAKESAGVSWTDIAANFATSKEYVERYGANSSNDEFVTHLYDNVLHREAEGAGYNFWVTKLGEGVSRGDVILAFSESPENQALVIGSIQNGIDYIPHVPA